MKKNAKKIFITSIFLLTVSGLVFAYAPAKSEVCKSDVKGFCIYTSQAGNNQKTGRELAAEAQSFVVPGIEFLGISGNATLGDVLVQLYKYLLGLVGLSSLLMLIWGGFEYATATDKGVGDAKKKIGNALFGLALALISYLGLLTINPDFVKKLNLTLEPITMGTGNKELCIAGAGCTDIRVNCSGKMVCNDDGTLKECKPDTTCKNTENTSRCFITAKCANGVDRAVIKDFGSAKACSTGCSIDLGKNLCEGESVPTLTARCGTPPLPGH